MPPCGGISSHGEGEIPPRTNLKLSYPDSVPDLASYGQGLMSFGELIAPYNHRCETMLDAVDEFVAIKPVPYDKAPVVRV